MTKEQQCRVMVQLMGGEVWPSRHKRYRVRIKLPYSITPFGGHAGYVVCGVDASILYFVSYGSALYRLKKVTLE